MTHGAVGFGRGFPRSWIFPITALTILLGIAALGGLSRSIVADLIAWWPMWVAIGIAAYLLRERNIGGLRVAGLIPLVAFVIVLLFIWGHLAGWAVMPSASQRLVGPDAATFSEAALVADVDGEIGVSVGEGFLYAVEPIRGAGHVGIPAANEHVDGSTIEVDLDPPEDPGFYSYAGWDLALSTSPDWHLDLSGVVDADLTSFNLNGLNLDGAGTVRLGTTLTETAVTIRGSYSVVIPAGAQARVIGVASVPATWTLTQDGAVSPAGGDGWVITVVGDATLNLREG